MEIREEIKSAVSKVLGDLRVENFEIVFSSDLSHADFSTNISLTIFHKLKEKFKNPLELAEYIANQLQKKVPNIDKIEASAPGFINFFVSNNFLFEKLDQITAQHHNFGKGSSLKKKKVMLEFADPNPFKEFHIGHLRNITLGESYSRLVEFQGADLWRANYQGDVGLHVAKAVYGLQSTDYSLEKIEKKSLDEKIKILGEAYAKGAKAYEEDDDAKKEIQEINLDLYNKGNTELNKLWEKGRQWSLAHFEKIYKRVGTKYKKYYFESQTAKPGRELVLQNISNGIFEKHEGAVVFRGNHTRVFITKEDYATYEAKDLALAKLKYEDFKYDKSIIITASEQEPYFKVILEALAQVLPDLAKKTTHYAFGFVNLKDGKMSSRSGNVIAGEWLLDEAKKRLKSQFKEMDEETLEKVAVGAVKYSMLKFSRRSDITFSFEESISLEGNSGPYIQYTFARTQSVLAKSQISNLKSQINTNLEKEEEMILRLLIQFGRVAEDAAENFAPNMLANYLFELSQVFNNFYQKHKIIGSEEEEFRLKLTSGVGQILKTGLYLLGIEAPQKM